LQLKKIGIIESSKIISTSCISY